MEIEHLSWDEAMERNPRLQLCLHVYMYLLYNFSSDHTCMLVPDGCWIGVGIGEASNDVTKEVVLAMEKYNQHDNFLSNLSLKCLRPIKYVIIVQGRTSLTGEMDVMAALLQVIAK